MWSKSFNSHIDIFTEEFIFLDINQGWVDWGTYGHLRDDGTLFQMKDITVFYKNEYIGPF